MDDVINKAVSILKSGGIIALPTETVYGLAVDARNPQAIDKLYALKGRPANKPTTIAISSQDDLAEWTDSVDDRARLLMDRFWPGPLTIIFPSSLPIVRRVHALNSCIGIRCSSASVIQSVLSAFGGVICLSSANLSGHKDAVTAEEIRDYFGDAVYIIEDDSHVMGKPSTIVDLSQHPHNIIREGEISAAEIEQVLYTSGLSQSEKIDQILYTADIAHS